MALTKKERMSLLTFSLAVGIIGCFLIQDWKIIIGVILLMWSNNISQKQ